MDERTPTQSEIDALIIENARLKQLLRQSSPEHGYSFQTTTTHSPQGSNWKVLMVPVIAMALFFAMALLMFGFFRSTTREMRAGGPVFETGRLR